ncbi:Hpt domain-containing protein [Granulosicoccus antarcticus]|uniref:HPt domain-containing protein n=1 Tax=Granulosicoccus antarcticus IMCC3135 TaxID=1192854 RepID=A0A2Z2P464_9GAMM|nr:Hpt domain-containing protein [Granulosicoccus antarcticus]ASJ75457.1 hypothetical protein IMCC3135_27010 [Granulosicoccus antarcticus IMCC3135]
MTIHIDPHALQAISSLQRPGKPDLLTRIVELFKSESPESISALQLGLDSADLQAVGAAAHCMKSSSAYLGARLLSERFQDIENAAHENDLSACRVLGGGVDALYEASIEELDNHVSAFV